MGCRPAAHRRRSGSQPSSRVRAVVQGGLPVAWREIGVGPALGQLAGRFELARSFARLAPAGRRRRRSTSAGSSMTRMASPTWSMPVAGASTPLQISAASPSEPVSTRRAGRSPGAPGAVPRCGRVAPRRARRLPSASRRQAELAGRHDGDGLERTRRRAGRSDRTRAATRPRRRTTPAAPAAAGRAGSSRRCRRVVRTRRDRRPPAPTRSRDPPADAGAAPGGGEPAAGGRAAALSRSATGKRPLEERLDAGDEDACVAGMPSRERSDPRRRLVADELRALVGERGPWLERDDGRRPRPGGQLLRDAIGDLRVAGDPDQPLAGGDRERRGQERLGAVRHRRRSVTWRRSRPTPPAGVLRRSARACSSRSRPAAPAGPRGRPGRGARQRCRGAMPSAAAWPARRA